MAQMVKKKNIYIYICLQCNAGDLGSIPGLGRSSGEGNSWRIPRTEELGGMESQTTKDRVWRASG